PAARRPDHHGQDSSGPSSPRSRRLDGAGDGPRADCLSARARPAGSRAAHRRQRPRRPPRTPRGRADGLRPAPIQEPRYHGGGGGSGRMAVLSVRKYGDPVLRRRAKPVEAVTPDIKRMIADMVDTMYDEVGLGLAAPQVGISLRLMVVGDDEGREARALINPVIAEQGGEIVAEEGCLSIPGVFAPVRRAEWVRLEAQDDAGRPVSITARGLRARVFQHEMD